LLPLLVWFLCCLRMPHCLPAVSACSWIVMVATEERWFQILRPAVSASALPAVRFICTSATLACRCRLVSILGALRHCCRLEQRLPFTRLDFPARTRVVRAAAVPGAASCLPPAATAAEPLGCARAPNLRSACVLPACRAAASPRAITWVGGFAPGCHARLITSPLPF